jgi:hypothetical protein
VSRIAFVNHSFNQCLYGAHTKEWPQLVERVKPKFWFLAVCQNGRGGVADRGALRRATGADDHRDCCTLCQVYVPALG